MDTPKPITGLTHSWRLSLLPARVLLNTMEFCQQGQSWVTVGWETRMPAPQRLPIQQLALDICGRVCPSPLAPPTGY